MQEFEKEVGRRVRTLRAKAGWTQGELAERADLSDETVGRLERGERLTIPVVRAVASALGVRFVALLEGSDRLATLQPASAAGKRLAELMVKLNGRDQRLLLQFAERLAGTK